MRGLPLVALTWLLATSARAQAPPLAEESSCALRPEPRVAIRLREGLVYAGARDVARRFDLARPADRERRPAVVLIHGGGWAAGSRALSHEAMRTFAQRGYVAVSVGYRLARPPRNTFPAAVSDVRCAVRRLRADADRHGIDPDRIAAVGFSAGGHLAAMLALAADVSALDDGSCPLQGVEPRVAAAVAWYARLDLRTIHRPRSARIVGDFLGALPDEAPARAALASPIVHAGRGDAPMLLVQGTDDHVVPVEHARAMLAELRRSHVASHLLEIPGGRHGFPFGSPRNRAAACATVAAIDRWLRGR